MKVRYDGNNCAYLDAKPDGEGVYHGFNKYTDEPVSLRWNGVEWVEPPTPEQMAAADELSRMSQEFMNDGQP